MLARHLLATAALSAHERRVSPLCPRWPLVRARQPAPSPVGTAMCVDLSNNRGNGTLMYQWQCDPNNTNQKFVLEDGLIKVEDTIGTSQVMCLDSSNGRTNGTRVYQWQCLSNTNQLWVVQRGQIILKSTLDSGNRLCLDATGEPGQRHPGDTCGSATPTTPTRSSPSRMARSRSRTPCPDPCTFRCTAGHQREPGQQPAVRWVRAAALSAAALILIRTIRASIWPSRW